MTCNSECFYVPKRGCVGLIVEHSHLKAVEYQYTALQVAKALPTNSESTYLRSASHNRDHQRRVYCVMWTHPPSHKNAKAAYELWGRFCDGIGIFTAKHDPELPAEQIVIDVPGGESHDNMWQKTRAIVEYIYKKGVVNQYDYFFTCGDDNYVLVDNLRRYIHSLDTTKHKYVYLGFRMLQGVYFNTGGAGYLMNRATLEVLYNSLPTCMPHHKGSEEDLLVAVCLNNTTPSIKAMESRDIFGRQYFIWTSIGLIEWYNLTNSEKNIGWFVEYTKQQGHVYDLIGIHPEVISLHLMIAEREAFHSFLYGVYRKSK